jgi:hypothetical protein
MAETITPSKILENAINSWSLVEKKHHEDFMEGNLDNPLTQRHYRLYIKAQSVVTALRQYKVAMEE